MPGTLALATAQLAIILDRPLDGKPHRPGDTIAGRVYRTAPGVAPEAKVTVTIRGRCKSKINIRRGNSTSVYRTNFDALSTPTGVETHVLTLGQPLHIPQGSPGESWPFAIKIPDLVYDIRDEWQQKYFTAPGGHLDTPFPPPASYVFTGSSLMGDSCYAFTEYWVEAHIELLRQHKGRTVADRHTAIAPFPLRNVHLGPAITEFNMREFKRHHTTWAYRLVPGTTKISFGQKTRQLFASSKVPKIGLRIRLSLPHTLQVGNEQTIPTTLHIDPDLDSTSLAIHGIQQEILITAVRVKVKPTTTVQAERHDFSKSTESVSLVPPGNGNRPLRMVVTPGGKASEPLALGEILGIRLPAGCLYPNLITYNIVRSHELKWELDGEIAGSAFKLGSWHPVRVLPEPDVEGPPRYAP
ncbi:uncharacterized protein ANIA_05622 [Aspergillus nidulans FGSC A4]|uniref:Arrestin-like N-terminal domain-containing protein n=1 Tax=Emericella nidulans (strain FGSC A4 / ATCC 38163 / CBS 112.46 / NRRL 194 / M139) TaxID=227321 RepID=C8VFX6_EMENI|nr:hypothetical protein [Aspergillus nidulans FGSC A4]CBF81533.1 TPA: conserved hypothetical protein [Aspergillus nidulans FGSC A4]